MGMEGDWIGFGVRLSLDSTEWRMKNVGQEKAEFSEICKWNLREQSKNLISTKILRGLISLTGLAAKLSEGLEPNFTRI